MSRYATKTDLEHVYTSRFALKSSLTSLKTELDKLDIGKLVPVPVETQWCSKNDIVKKAAYNKLFKKVNNFDISRFVLKTKHDTDKLDLETKSSDTSGLVKKTDYITKFIEIENKIPSISGFTTNATLTAVQNKIPAVSTLVEKPDYSPKISEIELKLLIKFMRNILLLQSLISLQHKRLLQG